MPALLGGLLLLVVLLCFLVHVAWGCNFIVVHRSLAFTNVLNKLVHLGHALVILLESIDLLVEEGMLFVTHLKVLFEAVDIDAQLLILISKLHVEVLLEVQITLHIGDLAVPKVQLTSLLLIILLHQGDAMVHLSLLLVFFLDL